MKSRTIALLRILLVAAVVGPAILLAAVGWFTYQAAFEDAKNELVRTSQVAREHSSKVFDSFQLVSGRVEEILDELSEQQIANSERQLHDKFVKLIRDLPQIQSLLVVGRDGHPQVATALFPVDKAIDFSDRDYFDALKQSNVATYISRIQISRVTGRTFFGWGHARRGPNGEFEGAIDIAVSPEFFMRFYSTLVEEVGEGPDGRVVTMIRDDGQLLVRFPAIEGIPIKVPHENPFFAAIRANPERGVYTNQSVVDVGAPRRLFAFSKVPNHPVYVVAGRSIYAIQADWWDAMRKYFVVATVATILLTLATLMTLRGAHREQTALATLRGEMTRREAAEEQLRHAQKMEAVGQLTGGIAHDFNNLLTVIRGSLDLLQRPQLSEDRRRRYLDAISQTTDRAAKLTGQLLSFARRQALKPEVFDAVESLARVQSMVRSLMGPRVVLQFHAPERPVYIRADIGQFDSAVVNMAVNARDAMAGEGALTITVAEVGAIPANRSKPAVSGEFVAISITDTGSGMAPEILERIFEPFFTTKTVGQGTGLGLSQVIGFAEQSGGAIIAASQVGVGATFTLYLPRVAAAVHAAKSAPDDHSLLPIRRARVLVVEDNPDVGAFVSECLEELGCESILVDTAQAALDELENNAGLYDAVFSDVVMPGMSGVDLAREVRRRHGGLPVLLASGYSDAVVQGEDGGFPLLKKPYSMEELAAALRKVLKPLNAA